MSTACASANASLCCFELGSTVRGDHALRRMVKGSRSRERCLYFRAAAMRRAFCASSSRFSAAAFCRSLSAAARSLACSTTASDYHRPCLCLRNRKLPMGSSRSTAGVWAVRGSPVRLCRRPTPPPRASPPAAPPARRSAPPPPPSWPAPHGVDKMKRTSVLLCSRASIAAASRRRHLSTAGN